MNYFSDNPDDIGITVVGGLTGLGKMTQSELNQKISRVKKPLIMDEFWDAQKSDVFTH